MILYRGASWRMWTLAGSVSWRAWAFGVVTDRAGHRRYVTGAFGPCSVSVEWKLPDRQYQRLALRADTGLGRRGRAGGDVDLAHWGLTIGLRWLDWVPLDPRNLAVVVNLGPLFGYAAWSTQPLTKLGV